MANKLVQAFAAMEGFYKVGTRPHRNNNPGDIEAGKFAVAHGATGSDGRFAIFPSPAEGFGALTALLLTPGYVNLTVRDAINRYAPPVENNTDLNVHFVCTRAGCQPTDSVGDALKL